MRHLSAGDKNRTVACVESLFEYLNSIAGQTVARLTQYMALFWLAMPQNTG